MATDPSPNPFAPPASPLQDLPVQAAAPSIEEALSRGYDFAIGALLSEAWDKTHGIKGFLWGGFVIYTLAVQTVTFVLGLMVETLFGLHYFLDSTIAAEQLPVLLPSMLLAQFVIGLIGAAMGYPFLAGINMIGIRQAAGQPASFSEMFNHFGQFKTLLVTGLLMTVLIYLGFFLLIIPGLYLAVAYVLAVPLAAERKLSAWQALETSRKAISQHWFKVFGLFCVLGLLLMASIFTLGIGLVWTMPLTISAMGVLYRTIFGVLPVAE